MTLAVAASTCCPERASAATFWPTSKAGGRAGAVAVSSRGTVLTFEISKNLLNPGDVAEFNKILWKYLRVCRHDARLAFDLCWESMLSFFAVGSIVVAMGGAAKIAVIRPPDAMYLVFKSHRFEELVYRLEIRRRNVGNRQFFACINEPSGLMTGKTDGNQRWKTMTPIYNNVASHILGAEVALYLDRKQAVLRRLAFNVKMPKSFQIEMEGSMFNDIRRQFVFSFQRVRFASIFFALLAIFGYTAADASANWTLDASIGERYSDNVTYASSSDGKKGDSTTLEALSVGARYGVGETTGVGIAANFKNGSNAKYGGLNVISSGLSLSVSQKLGLGPEAVRLAVYGSGSHDAYIDTSRDSTTYRAGFSASRWLGERIKLGIGYEYDKREQLYDKESFCIGVNCYNGDVYDVAGNSGILNLDFVVTEKDTIGLSYRHRQGDVTSSDVYTPGAVGVSKAYAPDRTFGGLFAYRLGAQTDLISVGWSRELLRKMSLDLNYTYYTAGADGGLTYKGNIFNFNVAYSM